VAATVWNSVQETQETASVYQLGCVCCFDKLVWYWADHE